MTLKKNLKKKKVKAGDSPKVPGKLCVPTKFPHQETGWNLVFYVVNMGALRNVYLSTFKVSVKKFISDKEKEKLGNFRLNGSVVKKVYSVIYFRNSSAWQS